MPLGRSASKGFTAPLRTTNTSVWAAMVLNEVSVTLSLSEALLGTFSADLSK